MKRESRGIQSIEVGGELLRALARCGEPMVLRQGTNNITCTPNAPGGTSYSVSCYGNALRAQRDFQAKEKADGKDAKAQAADMQAAMVPKPDSAPDSTNAQSRWRWMSIPAAWAAKGSSRAARSFRPKALR